MEIVITAEHLTKQAENRLLVADLCFNIEPGTIFGLIGPRESGKTTAIRLLTGCCLPTSGDARVFGQSISTYTDRIRRRIGYMPQQATFYPDLTVWENLNFHASLYGMRPFRRKRFRELLTSLELYDLRNTLAAELAGPHQRKLSLAAALVHRPELIFIDEPALDLSGEAVQEFDDYFSALRSAGRTLFIASQSPSHAAICDQLALIFAGRLLTVGTPDEVRRTAFGGDLIDLKASGLTGEHLSRLAVLSFVQRTPEFLPDGSVRLVVPEASEAVPALTTWCADQNLAIQSVQQYCAPFDETFSTSVAALYG